MSEPDMQAWRAEVREWLASVLPRRSGRSAGPVDYAVFQNITEEAERELLDKVRAYRKQRYDAGYGAIALAADLGGAGLRGAAVDGADQRHDRTRGPDHRGLRHPGPADEVRPGLPALGPAVLPAVQRAGGGFGPRRGGDERGAPDRGRRGRRRMAARRAEGLVVGGPLRRLRP